MTDSIWDSDPELKQIREEFIDSFGDRREQMASALGNGDWPALRIVIHSLAGVAGSYGFPEMSEVAGRIDDAWDGTAPPPQAADVEKLMELLISCGRAPASGSKP